MKNLKILFALLFFIVGIDEIFFGRLIWSLPNESPWGTNHFFNFVYELKKIENKEKTKKRILAIGSSVAYYSIDKKKFETEFKNKFNEEVELEYLSYAGMTPLDAYLLKDKIISLKPDLVLYLINFIDYRLHRAAVINPNKTIYDTSDEELLLDALNFGDAPQSRFAFPFETFKEFFWEIPLDRSSDYLAATLFRFFRYREIYLPNLKNILNHRFSRNTSYHGYAGIQIPERVNALGWTTKEFSFETKKYMYEEGFYIEVVSEILKSGKLEISILETKKPCEMDSSDRRVEALKKDCCVKNSCLDRSDSEVGTSQVFGVTKNSPKVLQKIVISKTGWTKIKLDSKIKIGSFAKAVLSDSWIPNEASEERKDYSYDILGVRLQQTFGLEKPLNDMQYVREERIEDLRYLNMNEDEYKKYFEYRLLSDFATRPGIRYLLALRDTKIKLTSEKFKPKLHFNFLKKFTDYMNQNKMKLLLINHPENPISLSWYEKSDWYKEHLLFLHSLNSDYVRFEDYRNELKSIDFADFHHTTYQGLEKLNPKLVNSTEKLFKK